MALADIRQPSDLRNLSLAQVDELAAEITAAGGKTPHIIVIDITEPDAPTILAQAAEKALAKIDILINSAGGSKGPIHVDTPDSAWDESMTLNFVRVRQLTHAALPGMMQRKWGRIINVTNIGAKQPRAKSMPTTVTRAAGLAMTKALSKEFAADNILVNSVCIGLIRAGQHERKAAKAGISVEQLYENHGKDVPLGRVGRADDRDRIDPVEKRIALGEVKRRVGKDVVARDDSGPEVRLGIRGHGRRRNGPGIGQAVIIVTGIDLRGFDDLAQVVAVDGALGLFADGADGRDDNGGQNADDRNNGQQLDQSER